MADKHEVVHEVGYINHEMQYAMISVHWPALLNVGADFVQIALTIEGAIALRAELDAFLQRHRAMLN